jgi:hypothetical protein
MKSKNWYVSWRVYKTTSGKTQEIHVYDTKKEAEAKRRELSKNSTNFDFYHVDWIWKREPTSAISNEWQVITDHRR